MKTPPHPPQSEHTAPAIRFDPLSEQHLPMLREWLLRPHVAQWWGEAESIEQLRTDYLVEGGRPGTTQAYIAHAGSRPLGFIQCYVVLGSGGGWWEDETDPGARGIDQFLANGHELGQGWGRRMIKAFVQTLFEDPAVTVVQTDPAPDNLRAVRCYTAAGFVPVGRVETPDGTALLMRCTRESLAQR